MSLINDALKRARLSRKKQDPSPTDGPPLEPVETPPPSKRPPWIWVPVCLLLGCGGVWFVWQWWNSPGEAPAPELTQNVAPPKTESAQPIVAPPEPEAQTSVVEQVEAPTVVIEPSPSGEISEPAAPTNAIVAPIPTEADLAQPEPKIDTNRVSAIAVAEAPVEEPEFNLQPARPVTFPELKVQGIFFRLKNPSVLINNRTLFVGSRVDGVTVVEIQRYKVVLELNGARKELFFK